LIWTLDMKCRPNFRADHAPVQQVETEPWAASPHLSSYKVSNACYSFRTLETHHNVLGCQIVSMGRACLGRTVWVTQRTCPLGVSTPWVARERFCNVPPGSRLVQLNPFRDPILQRRLSVTYLVKGFFNLQIIVTPYLCGSRPSLAEYAMFILLLAGQVFVLCPADHTVSFLNPHTRLTHSISLACLKDVRVYMIRVRQRQVAK